MWRLCDMILFPDWVLSIFPFVRIYGTNCWGWPCVGDDRTGSGGADDTFLKVATDLLYPETIRFVLFVCRCHVLLKDASKQ